MEQEETAGPILNDAMMTQIKAAIAEAIQPLDKKIGQLEAQVALLATREHVQEQVQSVKATANEAMAAARAAATEAQEAQNRMAEVENKFTALMSKMDGVLSQMEASVSGLAGKLETAVQMRDERMDAIEDNGQRRDQTMTSQGIAIGDLNTKVAVQEERLIRLEAAVTRYESAAAQIESTTASNAAKLDRIEAKLAKPGAVKAAAQKLHSIKVQGIPLTFVLVGLVAFAVITAVAPDLARGLYHLLTGQ